MTLSKAEINAIIKGARHRPGASKRRPWIVALRRMLGALAELEFHPGKGTPLVKLCEAGARYGWRDFEAACNSQLFLMVSPRAEARLKRDLQRSLERLTRPGLELERTSFRLALASIDALAASTDPAGQERRFLGNKPSDRLFSLFKKFPVLARLWCQTISQWSDYVTEFLLRFRRDRHALSHTFLGGRPIGMVADFRCSLSDPHHHGRTAMQLKLEAGSVVYKPRPGDGEWEWGALIESMNAHSFRPKLRAGRVLRRRGYCWMEWVAAASCKDGAEARRFYERMGGMIAAAYLLKAVDCHRDNLIAAGEYPVLVDADALWHSTPSGIVKTPLELLYHTGFFPSSKPRSLQSRSSILGQAKAGQHIPRIGKRSLHPGRYEHEIVKSFSRAWLCLLGTKVRRKAFLERLRRIRSRPRRCIYWPTEKYAAIMRASIHPASLLSGIERFLLITRLCQRSSVSATVIQKEVQALKGLDIPYFVRSAKEPMSLDIGSVPASVIKALRRALH